MCMSVHAYVLCVCVHVTMHVCVCAHVCMRVQAEGAEGAYLVLC